MFVELHLLQNFAPSNLNRDDTGSPKDCEFGGYRRARISSQCLKRAIRGAFREEGLLARGNLAERTKMVADDLARRLRGRGHDGEEARQVVEAALGGVRLALKDGKTQYLLFIAEAELAGLAEQCHRHWDALLAAAAPAPADTGKGGATRGARDAKKQAKESVPAEVSKALSAVLDGGKAADLALFGRMLADLPEKNVDAACQVAHAISTHRVGVEFDFYTAVDDLLHPLDPAGRRERDLGAAAEEDREESAGAGMLGTVEFNSACFYRYANLDLAQLKDNLRDEGLARTSLEAFLRASFAAVPTGKQNSFAAHNPPSFALAVVRERGLWSLTNAFVQPVHPGRDGDLVQNSVRALDRYWGRLVRGYGEKGIAGKWAYLLEDAGLELLGDALVDSVDEVVEGVLGAASFGNGRATL